MDTHKFLLTSVAATALLASSAFAQTAEVETDADLEMETEMAEGADFDADGNELDADGNIVRMADGTEPTDSLTLEGSMATANAMGGQIVVEQGDAEVDVSVADPVVTVDQAQPEVLVEQAQPEITVTVAEPTVTVEQQAPIITIEQAQPEVTVSIPEPTITVRMPEPDVNVATAEPQISVDQPQPIVRFVRPEPRITIEESEPNVQVTSAEPEIRVNRAANADISVEQAEANVSIEQEGEGNVRVSEAQPVVNIEQADDPAINVEQAEANVQIEGQDDPNVVVTDAENMVDADRETPLVTAEASGLYGAFADARVADLVGMNVLGETGNDVGEIDRLIAASGELFAIVGVGGFLGLGEHDVAIPLDEFSRTEDGLMINTLTEGELENMPEWDEQGEVMPLGMTVRDAY